AEDLAVEVHLEHAADAADVEHRVRTAGEAERPGIAAWTPFLLEIPVRVEGLDAAVLPVGDIERVVSIDHDRVRRVEVARSGAAFAPAFHQIAILAELGHARFAVAVGYVDAAVRPPGDVGRLVEIGGSGDRALDHVGGPGPGLRAATEHHLDALLG